MAGKLLLLNPRRRRAKVVRKAAARKHRFYAKTARKRKYRRSSARAASVAGRVLRYRRRNPIAVRGIMSRIVPMTVDAVTGAAGAIAVDWVWGQINRQLPATLQSVPGTVGVGDAVKVASTVALGVMLDRPTGGWAMRAAKGALIVQMDRLLRTYLPENIRMNLAYANPAPVTQGQFWSAPNRVRRGSPLDQGNVGALMRPGDRSPLLNGVGALMRPGDRSPLLSAVPRGGMRVRY